LTVNEAVIDAKPATAEDDILFEARARFARVSEAESQLRADMRDDLLFRKGEQWDPRIKAERILERRPMLTIDKLRAPLRQIVNQQRVSKLAIDVHPKGGEASEACAEVFQGLIRHIEVESSAEVAYSWAFEYAAAIGRGFFRILTEYANDGDDDQDIVIRRILNPFTVYPDPAAVEPDYSDMRFCFVVEDLTPEEFKLRYPNAEPASAEVFRSIGDEAQRWLPGGKVRVAEYWRVVERLTQPGVERRARRRVEQIVMSGAEVLEKNQWAGRYIPIVPVIGEELEVDGERIYQGIIRPGRDPQRMYNYWVTAQTEMIALAPRAPWVVAEGQDEGHPEWRTANTRNHHVLRYKPTTVSGQLVPPPERNYAEPPIQAITVAIGQANEDLKGTTGVYDPSLGRLSPSERSGRAIQALQQQGNMANAQFLDNLARALTYAGKILVDLIPHIYNRPGRVARLIGKDDQPRTVVLNAPFQQGPKGPMPLPPAAQLPGQELAQGVEHYDLANKDNRYSITVSVGPGYQTRRQEGADALEALIKANPALAPIVADVWVEALEFPGHQAIAKRLKKALPPQLQDDKEGQAPVPPQVQAYLAQLEQQHQALTEIVKQQANQLETDAAKAMANAQIKAAEIASRERIAAYQAQVELIKTQVTIDAKGAQMMLQAEIAQMQAIVDQVNQLVTGDAQRQHELALAQGEREHDMALTQQQQQHDASMGMMQGALAAGQAVGDQQHQAAMADADRQQELATMQATQAHEATMAQQQRGHERTLAKSKPAPGQGPRK
jgi:hypothetical protein